MQKYTSRQSYSLLIEDLPPPSLSLLRKLSQGGIAPMKLLSGKGSIDVILVIHEMYLQRSCEYIRGVFAGRDESGEFYGIFMVLMVVSQKKSIPICHQNLPHKTIIDGMWISSRIIKSIETLSHSGWKRICI